MKTLKSLLVSDFTINNLGGYLSNSQDTFTIEPVLAPFNQVPQVLLDPQLACWSARPDFAVVWCLPERIVPAFGKLLNNENVSLQAILEETDQFAELLKNLSGRVKFTLVASFAIDFSRFSELTSFIADTGTQHVLLKMNLRLAERLKEMEGFYLLDTQRWTSLCGERAWQPGLWYLSKIPFHNAVFEKAAHEIISASKAILGLTKKVLVIDLDDTIWGGIVGDIGWEQLILGGHNPLGEAFADFQRALKILSQKGVLLCIVSKNEEKTALTAIANHPEMILLKTDFTSWRINWTDKAKNITELSEELNIGLDAFVFIDDNLAERARVKEALPAVLVPELPGDKLLYPSFLRSLDCFSSPFLSKEDENRNRLYADEKNRATNKVSFQSLEGWLSTLNIHIRAEPISSANSSRIAQLHNKTNQFNLSTRRLSEQELLHWVSIKNNFLWAFSISDKFGDAGLCGILGMSVVNDSIQITDFIVSCRVIGRKLEETMLGYAIEKASNINCKMLSANYLPTDKNQPCLSFFEKSGMKLLGKAESKKTKKGELEFSWNCSKKYEIPSCVNFAYAL